MLHLDSQKDQRQPHDANVWQSIDVFPIKTAPKIGDKEGRGRVCQSHQPGSAFEKCRACQTLRTLSRLSSAECNNALKDGNKYCRLSSWLPSGINKQFAIENGHLMPFVVGFPIQNGGSFSGYVSLPEGRFCRSLAPKKRLESRAIVE